MKKKKIRHWSASVVSDSLEVPSGTFASANPRQIAEAVKAAAEKGSLKPYASAMSYLCFYLNRGGRALAPKHRRVVEKAKTELRTLFGRE